MEYITEKDSPGKNWAAEALIKIRGKESLDFLLQYIQNPNNCDRETLVFYLRGFNEKRVIDVLNHHLNSLLTPESHYISYTLEKIGNQQTILLLLTMEGEKYQESIRKIHERLKPQGYNPAVKKLAS